MTVPALLVPPFEAATKVAPAGSGSVIVRLVSGRSPVLVADTWYCTGVSRANCDAGVSRVLAIVPPVCAAVSVLLTEAVPTTGEPPVVGVPLVERLLVTTWPAVNGGEL